MPPSTLSWMPLPFVSFQTRSPMVLFAVAVTTVGGRLSPMFSVIRVSFFTMLIGPAVPVSGSNSLPSPGMVKA